MLDNLLQMQLKLLQKTKQNKKNNKKKAIQKTEETTGDMNGNKTASKITKFSRHSPQNATETVESEKYIYPEKKQKIIDDLRLT